MLKLEQASSPFPNASLHNAHPCKMFYSAERSAKSVSKHSWIASPSKRSHLRIFLSLKTAPFPAVMNCAPLLWAIHCKRYCKTHSGTAEIWKPSTISAVKTIGLNWKTTTTFPISFSQPSTFIPKMSRLMEETSGIMKTENRSHGNTISCVRYTDRTDWQKRSSPPRSEDSGNWCPL